MSESELTLDDAADSVTGFELLAITAATGRSFAGWAEHDQETAAYVLIWVIEGRGVGAGLAAARWKEVLGRSREAVRGYFAEAVAESDPKESPEPTTREPWLDGASAPADPFLSTSD